MLVNSIYLIDKRDCGVQSRFFMQIFGATKKNAYLCTKLMKDFEYTYQVDGQPRQVYGFVAWLLQKGDDWDIRCLAADMYDYQEQQYARMDQTIALLEELRWWYAFAQDPLTPQLPQYERLKNAGVDYLRWRVNDQVQPLSDSEKLSTKMAIYVDDTSFFYKFDEAMGLHQYGDDSMPDDLIAGFPAQLLSYAACSTMDACIRQEAVSDLFAWVDNIGGWLQSPRSILLHRVQFNIPDVHLLYATYLADAKATWEADNRKRYESGEPKTRYFMTNLLERTRQECRWAAEYLQPFLSEQQMTAMVRYMAECEQYIKDHITTKRQVRSMELHQYYVKKDKRFPPHLITRQLHEAATAPVNPAAKLAKVVLLLQERGQIIRDIRPHTHFIAVINKTFHTSLHHDSFSRHFRG